VTRSQVSISGSEHHGCCDQEGAMGGSGDEQEPENPELEGMSQ